MSMHKNYSEATAVEIDEEIRKIIDGSYSRVKHLLNENLSVLHCLATQLIEKENLTGDEVDRIIKEDCSASRVAAEETPVAP